MMTTENKKSPYVIRAIHVAERIRLRDLRERFSHEAFEFSNYEMVVRYSEDSYLFLYNYGSVVFFNVPEATQERELLTIQTAVGVAGLDKSRPSDTFLLEVDSNVPTVRVFFDRIVSPTLSYQLIKIGSMLVAESTGLEYYEGLIENLLVSMNVYSKRLQERGRMLSSSGEFIQFIGLCLNTKQEIISNLYIVDSPDETWDSPELDKVHQELKLMLEVDTRYRGLEYKIKIIQESVEVFVDLTKSRRSMLLELTVILLIALEIILSILRAR